MFPRVSTVHTVPRRVLTGLGIPLAHALAAAAATLNGAKDSIHICRPTPLLMRQNIDRQVFLSLLHQAHVGEHAILLEVLG